MKTVKNILIASVLVLSILSACNENEDNEKPVISNLEVGENDTIYAGDGVHMEFTVTDNDQLDYYVVEIHEETEHEKSIAEAGWEFDSTFVEIKGLKNYTVHHHAIKVPAHAEEGDYHCHIIVSDKTGNTLTVETELFLSQETHQENEENH